MISIKQTAIICNGKISDIENYELAMSEKTQVWEIHHRLETHTSDGQRRLVDLSVKELKALGMYYDRPPEELIFMTRSEHNKLHNEHRAWNKPSEETKRKISEAIKGKGNFWYGKHLTDKHKEKIRHALSKKVQCIETGIIYNSAKNVMETLHLDSTSIARCCKGKQETCGGYHWKYA